MKVRVLDSPYEKILEEGMKRRKISYRAQDPIRDNPRYGMGYRYVADFVVMGKHCKIVVEVDGKYHQQPDRKIRDTLRDYYVVTHGYDDVLRFTTKEIRTNLEGCLDQIEERVRAMDMVYQRQRERKHLDARSITESPSADQVYSVVQEVAPLLADANRKHPSSKTRFLRDFRRELQRRHFGLSYEMLHFHFPHLVSLLQQGVIEAFFSAYNIPFVLILGTQSFEKFEDHVRYVVQDPKIVKLLFHARINGGYLSSWKLFDPRHWVEISSGGTIRSDLFDQSIILKVKEKEAQELEKKILARYRRGKNAEKLEQKLRNTYRTIWKHRKERKVIVFSNCSEIQQKRLRRELRIYWNRVIQQNPKTDPFQEALNWFKKRRRKKENIVSIHDVTLFFFHLKKTQSLAAKKPD